MDLARWVADKRWVALLDFIDMLPTASRLNEAISNDPESAQLLAEQRLAAQDSEGGKEWSPRVSEYGLDQQMMGELINLNKQMLQALTVQITQKAPKAEKPFPVPRTAIEDFMERIERQRTVDFAGLFGFAPEDIY